MNDLSPKSQFLSLKDSAGVFRNVARSDSFQLAASFGVAQYALNFAPTKEQIEAVRDFIGIFSSIGDPIPDAGNDFNMPRIKSPEEIEAEVKNLKSKK